MDQTQHAPDIAVKLGIQPVAAMFKAEAGNCRVFFMRHLTLLNTPKNAKFRKSFSLLRVPWVRCPEEPADHLLRKPSLSDTRGCVSSPRIVRNNGRFKTPEYRQAIRPN